MSIHFLNLVPIVKYIADNLTFSQKVIIDHLLAIFQLLTIYWLYSSFAV